MSDKRETAERTVVEALELAYEYLHSTLAPCDADCTCLLHDLEPVLGLPDTRAKPPKEAP